MPKQTFLNLPEDKRRMILDRAIDEFAQRGYSDASISRIVETAKIAKGSFYQYFEGKEDLYGYIIDDMMVSRKLRVSEEESVKLEYLSLTDFLRVLLKRIMREFSAEPGLLKISLDYIRNLHEPVQASIYSKYKDIRDSYYQNLIQSEKGRGQLDEKVDNDMLSYMLIGASSEIIYTLMEKDHSAISDEYIDNWVDKIEYILTNGIYSNTAPENTAKRDEILCQASLKYKT